MEEQDPDTQPSEFTTLRDLLEGQDRWKRGRELAKRIRLEGIWTFDEIGEQFFVTGDSDEGRRARAAVMAVVRFEEEVESGQRDRYYEPPPLDFAEGPDDVYSMYGWPPVEQAPNPVQRARKLTKKEHFDRQMETILEQLEALLSEDDVDWNRSKTLPGTVLELYEFACWVDPEMKNIRPATLRKKCRGLVNFKPGPRPQEVEDHTGHFVPELASPLGRLLESKGLRSHKELVLIFPP